MMNDGFPQGSKTPSAAAEAQAVPGAGCLCENPTDVVWCLTLGGIVAICAILVVSQTVCKSALVPKKVLGIAAGKGSENPQDNRSRVESR